ncbi:MAG: carbohydrate ABC transporter substrate-binding protein [Clostridia bacterium]|nr:carbohydrate ABC transporter substrate-binding protein [Clostridia bacterium]
MKKILSLVLCLMMVLSAVSFASAEATVPTIDQIKLGEDYTDLTATVKWLNHRTDLLNSGAWANYIAEFNKVYPNITVEVEGITDYAQDTLTRLTGSDDWGTMMGIPQVEASEFATYFTPLGSLETLSGIYNYADAKAHDGVVYGMPSTGNANGIVYNKAVFEKAGITELPKTPDEFIAALKAIKENTDAIPLYTNYAAGWTMGAWDAYLGGSLGDADFMNNGIITEKDPFANKIEGAGPYAVYKILYDAVANGLIEEDYTTTDWEGCKGMINRGEIGCMVLGSWAHIQMVEAGPNGDDIGYMAFPITVNGKQYANAGADYCYAINVKAPVDEQIAAMVLIKWLTHESGFAYNEGGTPINKDGEFPALYAAFDGVDLLPDNAAVDQQLIDDLNADSNLSINRGGDAKIQKIIEHAFNGTKTFDEIMTEWNEAWSDAQADHDIEVK